jgi:hypothetical protein
MFIWIWMCCRFCYGHLKAAAVYQHWLNCFVCLLAETPLCVDSGSFLLAALQSNCKRPLFGPCCLSLTHRALLPEFVHRFRIWLRSDTFTWRSAYVYVYLVAVTLFIIAAKVTSVDRNSSIDIAIRYGLDGPGIGPRWRRDFPHPSRTVLGPTHLPVPGLFLGVKGGVSSTTPSIVEGKERVGLYRCSPFGPVLGVNLTFHQGY